MGDLLAANVQRYRVRQPLTSETEFAADGEDAFPSHGRLTPEKEQLRKLEHEHEILHLVGRAFYLANPVPGTSTARFTEGPPP
jgi:hypothetical protein